MDKFSNPALHVIMRDRLCNKLHDIFVSKEFTGQWSYNTCPSGEALVHPEARFVWQFIHNFRYGIFPQNWENGEEVSLRDRLNYINKKRELPDFHDTEEEILAKYGSDIDLYLCGMMKKNKKYMDLKTNLCPGM